MKLWQILISGSMEAENLPKPKYCDAFFYANFQWFRIICLIALIRHCATGIYTLYGKVYILTNF